MTYEEYVKTVYDECKTYGTAKAYPDEFEKTFKEVEESGLLKRQYERGIPALGNCMAIVLQI